MSKKLKKNLETIGSKMARNNSQKKDNLTRVRSNVDDVKNQDFILSARLHTEERHEYQEEMIKNYLTYLFIPKLNYLRLQISNFCFSTLDIINSYRFKFFFQKTKKKFVFTNGNGNGGYT